MRMLALALVVAAGPVLQADILHLRNGTRYYGTLISQNEREVVFRVTLGDGASGAVRRFPRALVKRVESTPHTQPTRPEHPTSQPPATAPTEYFEQTLREAFELLDDGDLPAALGAMQRVVKRAPEERLAELDLQTQAARDVPLARLLAETRLRVALARGQGRTFRLRLVTAYEAEAMGGLLEEIQNDLLASRHQGRTIAEWAVRPDAYSELHPQARRMVADATFAAAVLGARLTFDPRLRPRGEQRRGVWELRDNVARFAAHVMSMRGYTALGVDEGDLPDPAARAIARLRAFEKVGGQSAPEDTQETAESQPGSQPAQHHQSDGLSQPTTTKERP